MVLFLQQLVRACQEGSQELDRTSSRASSSSNAQVSKRVLRAVLQAVFPDKPQQRHNALHKALHITIQSFVESSGSSSKDCVLINDLFSQGADGSQTTFIEEVRRQHTYEVIEFALGVCRKVADKGRELNLLEGTPGASLTINDNYLRQALLHCDPLMHHHICEKLILIACPEQNEKEDVGEALSRLRGGALLRHERLWLRTTPKDVMNILLTAGPSQHEKAEGIVGKNEGNPKRLQAVKVVANPITKVHVDIAAQEQSLQTAMQKAAQRNDEMVAPLTGVDVQ